MTTSYQFTTSSIGGLEAVAASANRVLAVWYATTGGYTTISGYGFIPPWCPWPEVAIDRTGGCGVPPDKRSSILGHVGRPTTSIDNDNRGPKGFF